MMMPLVVILRGCDPQYNYLVLYSRVSESFRYRPGWAYRKKGTIAGVILQYHVSLDR